MNIKATRNNNEEYLILTNMKVIQSAQSWTKKQLGGLKNLGKKKEERQEDDDMHEVVPESALPMPVDAKVQASPIKRSVTPEPPQEEHMTPAMPEVDQQEYHGEELWS